VTLARFIFRRPSSFPACGVTRVSHDATPVIGEPYYLVAMLDWDDMESQGAALDSEAGNKTAEDAITNLSRYTTIRGMIVQLIDK
jgi:hypothetical protein